MQVVDGNVRAWFCELAVDPSYVPFYRRAQAPILGYVVPAWDGDLQECDLGTQVLSSLKQSFDGEQPFHDSLGVVETVHAEEQHPPGELVAEPLHLAYRHRFGSMIGC